MNDRQRNNVSMSSAHSSVEYSPAQFLFLFFAPSAPFRGQSSALERADLPRPGHMALHVGRPP